MQRMEEILNQVRKKNLDHIPGDEIFKLYDTFGFPVDLAEEYGKEMGLSLDMNGFNEAMQKTKRESNGLMERLRRKVSFSIL